MNTSSNITRFASRLKAGLRPTKPATASAPRRTAASKTRRMSSYFRWRSDSSAASMLSKYARSESPTRVECIARRTRAARAALKGLRRSSVFATGSRSAAAGTSLSVGCRAADSSMFGAPICRANCSHSSTPVVGAVERVPVVDEARDGEPDQHADTVSGERDQALGRALGSGTGLGVGVDLAGDEEEVVARAVEGDAEDQQEGELVRVAESKQHVAAGPGQHAEQQGGLHPEGLQEHRDQQHEHDFRHLPDGLLAGRIGNLNLGEELIGVLVVEGERNADQDGGEEEYEEVALPQENQCIDSEELPEAGALAPLWQGRRAGQREAVEAECAGRDRAHEKGVPERASRYGGMGVPGEQIADTEARDDPADRAPHPDAGEVSGGLIHLPEGDGVDQRQGRHVENHVREHARIEGIETPSAGQRVVQDGACDMNDAEQTLGIEIAIRDEPDDERGDDRAPGLRGVGEGGLGSARVQIRREVAPQRDEPSAPDEEFEKHHDAKTESRRSGHEADLSQTDPARELSTAWATNRRPRRPSRTPG